LADTFRASELIALDRFEEAFQVADESVATAQRNRQNWALGMSETWKGRQLLQLGRLSEAATSLEGRFSRGDADRIVAVLEASSVVALAKLKIHHGDDRGVREVADIATVMLNASAPGVRRHAAWCLALCAMFEGDAHDAHDGSARGAQTNGWPSFRSSRSRLRMTLSLSVSPWPSGMTNWLSGQRLRRSDGRS